MKVTFIKPGAAVLLLLALFSCKKPETVQQSDPGTTETSKLNSGSNFSTLVPSETVSVDFNVDQGAMTYRSSGLLKGMVPQTNASPPDWLVVPTKPQFDRVPMSYLGPLKPRHTALGLTTILVLSDDWGYHRGSWPGGTTGTDWTEYDTFLTNEVNQALTYGYASDKLHFDIWNEADGLQFWNPDGGSTTSPTGAQVRNNRKRFCQTYVHAYKKLKALGVSLGKQIIIEGPSLSIIKYQNPQVPDTIAYPFFTQWLDSAKVNNALPDYLTWHFPGNSSSLTAKTPSQEIDDVRQLYVARSLPAPQIIINEYISNTGTTLHANPGKAGWLASQHERAGIVGSVHAQFSGPENQMDNMILRDANSVWHPKGEWWWFMKYGNITGHKVSTTPSANIDLIAGKDVDSSLSKIVLGNRSGLTGPIAVQLNNLDKSYAMEGNGVFVTIEKIPWANGGAVDKIDTVLQGTYTVSASNQLTLVFDWGTDARDSYAITLGSKHQSTIVQAESLTVEGHSTSDVVRTFSDPAASGGAGSIIDANAVGDFVSYTTPTVAPGTYYVSARAKRYSSRGIFQFRAGVTGSSSGTDIGDPYDEYNATAEYVDVNLGKWKVGTNSAKYFKFTVTGVNASSVDPNKYSLAFDYFIYTKIAP